MLALLAGRWPRLLAPSHYCGVVALQANEILHHKLTLNGYLAEFTGQSMDTITADTDRDFFMSAQEAVSAWPSIICPASRCHGFMQQRSTFELCTICRWSMA